jgi:uncharacterized protein YbjT (DUF2867 family)
MNGKTATIVGSTGLIGSQILQQLINDDDFGTIKLLVRKPVSINNPKIKIVNIDFSNEEQFRNGISESDAVYCSIGTTNKKVKGDKAAYRKVDYEIPVNAAKYCAETGCPVFALVSSVGANSKSSNFYLKFKGEVEDAIREMKIESVTIFRPSMLMGKREEFRLAEIIGKIFLSPLSFLIPSDYKPIKASDVAKAMIAASKKSLKGFNVFHYKEMKNLIK